MKILYVEDNEDNVYVLKSRLTRAGHTVLVASDGAQAVTMAAAEQPNLILMDLSLPVLDGWEATRRIKAAPETRHIPVIALTRTLWQVIARRRLPRAAMTSIPSRSKCRGCSTRSRH
jgi:CheY-like chemotaxis protein